MLSIFFSASLHAAEKDIGNVTDLLKHRLGSSGLVGEPTSTPIKGVYQTKFGERYGYLIENGRYIIIGDLIDLKTAENFTEVSRRQGVIEELAVFKDSDMIIYPAKGETKEILTVFTDTSCPYCKKLHEEASHLTDAGIQVQYLPFPRGSKRGPGYKTMQQVWCAKDRPHAMHVAKGTEFGDVDNVGECVQASIVDKGFIVGNKIGVTGTPAMFTSKGEKIDGYVPHARLIPMLLN